MDNQTEKIYIRVSSPQASLREMEVEVAWEEVAREWEKILTAYVARARLDGFRPGKAPREMVKRLFFKEIRDDVVDILVPKVMNEAMREKGIHPLTNPVVSEISFREGEPLHFRARVEILPEFKLPPYRKIRVKKKEVKVEEREVDEYLERLRQNSAEYIPVEGRGVVEGDYVVLEWKAKDAKTRRTLPTEKVLVIAGHPENEVALNENLRGLNIGETRCFTASYPSGHPLKKFAGRTLESEIKVVAIKEKRVPELNDEWAKDLGEFADLAALREKVRLELERARLESARQAMGEEVVETIVEDLQLELPESLVEREAVAIVQSWMAENKETMKPEELENFRQRARKQAEMEIMKNLVLRRIAQEEGLQVNEEEIDEEIKTIARKNNVPLAQLTDRINQEGGREDLRATLLLRKAIDFLIENAVS